MSVTGTICPHPVSLPAALHARPGGPDPYATTLDDIMQLPGWQQRAPGSNQWGKRKGGAQDDSNRQEPRDDDNRKEQDLPLV
ncbi:hypothetical protein ACFONI_13220 [Aeromonas media]|uniref:hypothetical protein n=1 Tax=Aeromonas media TaxID=651 RepID=UPI00361DE64E